MKNAMVLVVLAGMAASAQAGLVTTRLEANVNGTRAADNTLSANEYGAGNSQSYAGNAATGFGGTAGNGTVYMGASTTDWQVGWQPGNNVNDLFVLYFNVNGTGPTTVTSSNAGDTQDGGRRASTAPYRDGVVNYPIPVAYTLVFGDFGVVLFSQQLTGTNGGVPGEITFLSFFGAASGNSPTFREVSIPWATIGATAGQAINFFGLYTSGTAFLSNEGLPSAFAGSNPGFASFPGQSITLADYNRFIPTPGAAALLGLGGLVAARRRRA